MHMCACIARKWVFNFSIVITIFIALPRQLQLAGDQLWVAQDFGTAFWHDTKKTRRSTANSCLCSLSFTITSTSESWIANVKRYAPSTDDRSCDVLQLHSTNSFVAFNIPNSRNLFLETVIFPVSHWRSQSTLVKTIFNVFILYANIVNVVWLQQFHYSLEQESEFCSRNWYWKKKITEIIIQLMKWAGFYSFYFTSSQCVR